MSYKKPDLTGPRVRRKSSRVINKKTFSLFKKQHPEHKDITIGQINSIVKKFNENIVKETVENRSGIILPEKLGLFIILAFDKPKKKIVDYGTSNKTGILSYHANWDTDNKIGKLVYKNAILRYAIKNNRFWGFDTSRQFKLSVSVGFKKAWSKYIQVKGRNIHTKT